jgi:predicted nucleic acid-binding protein
VTPYPIRPLLDDALAMRANSSLDDALYVTLARALALPFASTDERLNRAAAAVGLTIARP